MVRLFDTLGVFNSFSLNFRALGDGFFDAAAFAVVLGAFVDFVVDKGEQLGEVCRGPTTDAPKERMNSRHFCSQFTSSAPDQAGARSRQRTFAR